MNEEIIKDKMFDFLKSYKPQEVTDGFKNISGGYYCKIEEAKHLVGISENTGDKYDFYSIRTRVMETIEGDRGEGRFLDITFQNTDAGLAKLADTMFTIGVNPDSPNREEFDKKIEGLASLECFVRAWEHKDPSSGKEYYNKKIVKELKIRKSAKKQGTKKESEVPF